VGRSRVFDGPAASSSRAASMFSEVEVGRLPPAIDPQPAPEAVGHAWFRHRHLDWCCTHANPLIVPTVHLNYRTSKRGRIWGSAAGADLTPFYPFLDDAIHFHSTFEGACDQGIKPGCLLPGVQGRCDDTSCSGTAGETRGVGLFFDYQRTLSIFLYKGQDPQFCRTARSFSPALPSRPRPEKPRAGKAVVSSGPAPAATVLGRATAGRPSRKKRK